MGRKLQVSLVSVNAVMVALGIALDQHLDSLITDVLEMSGLTRGFDIYGAPTGGRSTAAPRRSAIDVDPAALGYINAAEIGAIGFLLFRHFKPMEL